MARGNWLRMERDFQALCAENPAESQCICRCKVLSEVLGVGWTAEVQARVDALRDPRREALVTSLASDMARMHVLSSSGS